MGLFCLGFAAGAVLTDEAPQAGGFFDTQAIARSFPLEPEQKRTATAGTKTFAFPFTSFKVRTTPAPPPALKTALIAPDTTVRGLLSDVLAISQTTSSIAC